MSTKSPSQRQLRVGEEIRHILANVMMRGCSGNALLDSTPITITEVRISPDFAHATVYVLPLKGEKVSEILAAFKQRSGYFKNEVAHKLTTRRAPSLMFHEDHSFAEASKVDELLQSHKVKRDIEADS